MIEKIENTKHLIRRIITLLGLGAVAGKETIFGLLSVDGGTTFVTILLLISILGLFTAIESMVEWSIDSSHFVRRLIMRKEDIEGEWLSVVRVNGKIEGGGLSTICFEKGSYVESGEHFTKSGTELLSWRTTISSYRDK